MSAASSSSLAGPAAAAASGGNRSPRARQSNRPKPFTLAMPQPASHQHHHGGWDQDHSATHSTQPSRPQSPSFYRSTVAEVHSVLYGGRGKDKEEIVELVQDYYDGAAVFENPIAVARGPEQIAEIFFLLGLLPGQMWSELIEISESAGYDGGRLVVMTHVLHIAVLPWLDPHAVPKTSVLHPSHSFYSSLPSTPYMTPTPLPGSPFSRTHPVTGKSSALWPIQALISALNPRAVLSTLTTLHLKLHTRLRFNENGKIIQHEDTWGLKETIEGVFPILAHLYELQRRGVGSIATGASRFLFRGSVPKRDEDRAGRSEDSEAARNAATLVREDLERRLGAAFASASQSFRNRHHEFTTGLMMGRSGSVDSVSAAAAAAGAGPDFDSHDRQSSHDQYLRSGYYAPVSVHRFENELAMRLSPTSEKQKKEAEAAALAAAASGSAVDGDKDGGAAPADADTSQITTMDHDSLSD